VSGAHVTVETELFDQPKVRYKCYFQGPHERAMLNRGIRVDFIPSDYRRFAELQKRERPRVMTIATAPPDADGWCSMSLHGGSTVAELRAAGAAPNRLLVVEASPNYPRTYGLPPEFRHQLHVDEIDVLIESDRSPMTLPMKEPDDVDRKIAGFATDFIEDGATLQAGIGALPLAIAQQLADGTGGDYGVHSELFNDGLMRLHQAGKVSNHKDFHDGKSVTTFALGSRELYDWLHENHEVAFLPVEQVNDPHLVALDRKVVTVNGALAIDAYGQIVADTLHGRQFSGVGGAEDFVSSAGYAKNGHSLLCMRSVCEIDGQLVPRIVPEHPIGSVVTTPRHQIDTVITEHGAARLSGLSVRERGKALAEISHPDFRDAMFGSAANLR
jgi:acyl-CoA hydrolase